MCSYDALHVPYVTLYYILNINILRQEGGINNAMKYYGFVLLMRK